MPIPAVCKGQLQVFGYTAHHRPSGRKKQRVSKNSLFAQIGDDDINATRSKKVPLDLPNQDYQVSRSLLSLCLNTCTAQDQCATKK